METLQELNEIIEDINMEIFNSNLSEDYYFGITLKTDGFAIVIDFLGCQIWSSEADERKYIFVDGEETDNLEPLEPYLIKQIAFIIDQVNKMSGPLLGLYDKLRSEEGKK